MERILKKKICYKLCTNIGNFVTGAKVIFIGKSKYIIEKV